MSVNNAPLLQMQGISKSFPGVKALKEVDFDLHSGEIHALLGANGAGKSTLMKIVSGAYTHDEGHLSISGLPVVIRTPKEAMAQGIYCVYQEVDTVLVPELTVTENVMMDRLVQGEAWVSWRKLHREAEAILTKIGASFSVRSKIDELSISQKQLVLIARAMAHKAKIIIFDEPTAPLSLEESERLFQIMDSLKREGVGLIFISHRLQEVFRISDRITVMRDGSHVLSRAAANMDIAGVIEAMLGKTFTEEFPKADVPIGGTLLEVKGLRRGTKVRGVSFSLRRGEILGVVGLVGAGKTELSRLLFGADVADGGEIVLAGRKLALRQPEDAVRAGIALVPEERRKQGVLVEETVKRNLSLPILRKLSSLGFVRRGAESAHAAKMVEQLGVQPNDPNRIVKHLSGGNQQKVAVGKWLPTNADVYMFDEPTKGVDVGAKSDIFRLIGQLAAEGKGIIYLSCELNEIIGIADRILIMSYGSVVKELSRAEATQDLILTYASAGEAE
ncbi:sugar ABC transporter ATP-binding protein [Paenibacillus sp. SYP-B3998]|uniref:Sugar ABC transporter ATP-binding protein n=1 Tax=Paenibacillus sp. SYP-B3998 TaxID=2678564 RepID=A0A6G4A459_9BACL|nr:sugar ABC transporter ATP-binding protein [Paenibacillus sp. SYP-B3998]NEW08437.1 sugar ABC transporter ATP-binding protein [Paenibacillus sp. SYP-B3998]